ncbi:MAG: citrate/2-methylcitrate synthase, partial [Nitrospirae bacterium]
MHAHTEDITRIIIEAAKQARMETDSEPEPDYTRAVEWPVNCTIGPGLEGAIACESKIGYVNGSKGWLIYRGYDIFDLCAYSTFEEVCYLLLHGELPNESQFKTFKEKLINYRCVNKTLRLIMSFPIEEMNAMAPLRMGSNMMRQEFTYLDKEIGKPSPKSAISADEDSIPMETPPKGEKHAIYEFKKRRKKKALEDASGLDDCYHLISGLATIAAAIARIRQGHMPIEPDPELSHAANLLYMITGKKPTPV